MSANLDKYLKELKKETNVAFGVGEQPELFEDLDEYSAEIKELTKDTDVVFDVSEQLDVFEYFDLGE